MDFDQTSFAKKVVVIHSFFQVLPLVFLVMAHNIMFCLSYHPIPTTEKIIKMIENTEIEDDQLTFNKVNSNVKVKPKEDFQQDLNVRNLRWYYSLSNTENSALDLFFRRFYV